MCLDPATICRDKYQEMNGWWGAWGSARAYCVPNCREWLVESTVALQGPTVCQIAEAALATTWADSGRIGEHLLNGWRTRDLVNKSKTSRFAHKWPILVMCDLGDVSEFPVNCWWWKLLQCNSVSPKFKWRMPGRKNCVRAPVAQWYGTQKV